MAAGIEVAVLLPGIWSDSVADFSQDLSAPDLALGAVCSQQSRGTLTGK